MAQAPELPHEQKIRLLTADPDLPLGESNRYGDLFLAAGRPTLAMMFYERAKDPERLARVKEDAIRLGDAFLLHWITRLSPQAVDAQEWREAGERALGQGKLLFARDCFQRAGDPERAEAAREAWLQIFPAPAALGKAEPPPPDPPAGPACGP